MNCTLGKECKTGFLSYLNYNEKVYGYVVFSRKYVRV